MSRAAVFFAFALSGASGLIYELVWVRMLSFVLGGTTFAIGVVLASFMAGLAAGSRALGRRADSTRDSLRLYALLELGVAVCAVLVPCLLWFAKPAYVAVAAALPGSALALLRLVLALVLLLPPTFCMGATLPVLGRLVVEHGAGFGRAIGLLYGANTAGAMIGTLASGFVLVPRLGLLGATGVAVGGNLIAAGVALILRRRSRVDLAREVPKPEPKRARPASGRATPAAGRAAPAAAIGPTRLMIVFALSGFAALGFELYWTRGLHPFLGNSTYAFATMLAVFLFGLAAGGWLGGRLADRVASPARLLGWVQIGIGLGAAATVPMLWNGLPLLEQQRFFSAPGLEWSSVLLRRFVAAFAVMALPTLFCGMMFPLVQRCGIATRETVGAGMGRFYAANTVGAIAGSLAAAWLVLPWLGTRGALLATAILSGVVGLWAQASNPARKRMDVQLGALLIVALVACAPVLHRLARTIPSDTQQPSDTVTFEREDATAATRIYRKPNGELHLSVDGRHIGGTEPGTLRKQKLLAHLPVALVPRAESILAVGLGSGITLGTLALYPEARALTGVEIVPGVVAAAEGFAAENHAVLRDPRVSIVRGDGVQFLLTTQQRFDIISSDSKLNPEFAGNASILSREYYELCRDHLTPHGVMVQWIAVHIPHSAARIVTRTFVDVFPYVELFWGEPGELYMVGSLGPIGFDFDLWQKRLEAPAVRADLELLQLDDPILLATSRIAGRERLAADLADAEPNTWLRPTYEFRVVRDFRLKAEQYHENDNLRWLAALWSPEDFAVRGAADAARLQHFRASTQAFLLGHAAGGGTTRLSAGREAFQAGLAQNPEDERLARVLQRLDAERSPGSASAGNRADALNSEPRDAASWLQRGLRHLDAREPEEALTCFDRAIAHDAHSAEARYDRLLALQQLGRAVELHQASTQFTRDFPRDARGWSFVGQIRAENADLAGSLQALQHAVDLDPTTASFRNNLAVTLVRSGRYADAAEAFARVHDLDPLFPEAAYSAAASYSLAARPREAAAWMEVCIEKRLCDPARFLHEAHFANLRQSSAWQQEHVESAAQAWKAR